MMGTKRTVDTGRRDSLGRPIKVSGHQVEAPRSTEGHGAEGDFSVDDANHISTEDMRYGDAINIISSLSVSPRGIDPFEYSKILDSERFLSNQGDKYDQLWDDSIQAVYQGAEEADINGLSFAEAEELMRDCFAGSFPGDELDSPFPVVRKLYGFSDDEERLLKINKRLFEDDVKNPRKKRMNKALSGKSQELLGNHGGEQEQAIFRSIANRDKDLAIYPLGGDMYQINYNTGKKDYGNSIYGQCFAYIPEKTENLSHAVFSAPHTCVEWQMEENNTVVSKNNIFADLTPQDKTEFLHNDGATHALFRMFSMRKYSDKKIFDDIHDAGVSIDYGDMRQEPSKNKNSANLNKNDYRELVYYNRFQQQCDQSGNDIRKNYNSDIEAFQAVKHGMVLTGKKSQKRQSNTIDYDAGDKENAHRKKAVTREGDATIDAIAQGKRSGELPENIDDIIGRYSHSTYHSYYEDSLYEGSIDQSFAMRKEWSHEDTVAFDKAMKYLQDNTPHNQRTLFRLSEVPQGHTVESFVQSLDVGDVTRTVRAYSSTMIGKKAVSKLLGDKDRKIVYRYNTTRGVSIAHDTLAEIVDEGEVIIPKDSEFVVAGTHYDDKSGNWIVDLVDNH